MCSCLQYTRCAAFLSFNFYWNPSALKSNSHKSFWSFENFYTKSGQINNLYLIIHGLKYHLIEVSSILIDHLHDSNYNTTDKDWHAQYSLGMIACHLIHCTVKTRVRVGICYVQHFSSPSNLSSYALTYTKPDYKKKYVIIYIQKVEN